MALKDATRQYILEHYQHIVQIRWKNDCFSLTDFYDKSNGVKTLYSLDLLQKLDSYISRGHILIAIFVLKNDFGLLLKSSKKFSYELHIGVLNKFW